MSLIAPETLLARLDDPDLRLADVRWWLADRGKGRRDYDAAHIPGAVFVDVDSDLVGPSGPGRHPLPSPAAFARRMAELGIDDGSEVVAYDDAGGTIAARLWWMLDALGHPQVHVLDGGIGAWLAIGGPVTAEVTAYPVGRLRLGDRWPATADRWPGTIDRDGLAARLGTVAVIDARAHERYRGDLEPVDAAPGHIPTAISLPAGGNLGPDGSFLDPAALAARFAGLGAGTGAVADGERDVVTYCGSGVTACHNALAMRIAGLPDPLLYPGSYGDWVGTGMPIATGDEPGVRPSGG
jgi:thiosulfate/3-mercaptopyruvate sulfurtransferase